MRLGPRRLLGSTACRYSSCKPPPTLTFWRCCPARRHRTPRPRRRTALKLHQQQEQEQEQRRQEQRVGSLHQPLPPHPLPPWSVLISLLLSLAGPTFHSRPLIVDFPDCTPTLAAAAAAAAAAALVVAVVVVSALHHLLPFVAPILEAAAQMLLWEKEEEEEAAALVPELSVSGHLLSLPRRHVSLVYPSSSR